MAEEVMNSGKRAILTKVKEEPISDDDEVICEPVAKSPKRSDNPSLSECVVKTEPRDEVPPVATRSSSAKIKIAIKATKEKHTVKINRDATVRELKNEAAKAFKMPVEKVCLIYSGKVLKDPDALSAISIEDGHILHLIVKTNALKFDLEDNSRKRNLARSILKTKVREKLIKQLTFRRRNSNKNLEKRNAQNINEKQRNPCLIGPNATIGIPDVLDPASSGEDDQNDIYTSYTDYMRQMRLKKSNRKKNSIGKKTNPKKTCSSIQYILLQRREMDRKVLELQKNINNIRKSIHILNKTMINVGNLLCTVLQKRYTNYNVR